MAVNDSSHDMSATGRRLFFGTNVFIVILLLAAVVIGINFLFTDARLNKRWDLSAGSSSYRLSQRTKNVLKKTGGDKIAITTVYTSAEPEYARKDYFPRVQDLCDEMAQLDKRVKVTHCYSPADKLALRNRVQGKFGGAAEKHNEVIAAAKSLWDDLQKSLSPVQAQIEALQRDDNAWLGAFSSLNRINLNLKSNLENLAETRRDVQDLTEGQDAMPKYQEASNKIKQANDQLKQTLEEAQKWCKDINSLATVLSNKDSDFAAKTRKQLEELDKLLANLAAGVGDPADTTIPDDPKPAIQDFAKASNALGRWLTEEVGRVNSFAKANPVIEQHPRWMLNVQLGPLMAKMPLSASLSETAQSVSENIQAVRQVLAKPDVPKDQLQGLLRQLRQIAGNLKQKLDQEWKASILAILDDGARIDQESKDFLARGSDGAMFKEILDKIADIAKKIEALPKLELDEVAERLQEENLVVIEVGDQVRVVKFDEVWPIADPTMRMRMDDSKTTRVFDGDSAISGALLAMTHQKKYATVIFVAYETEANPMARRMGQGGRNTGRIPLDQLSTLKEKLKQANFAVSEKDWNLGAEGADAERPQPEEGTEAIYVFLPPAETPPPNPMMGQQPEKGFGEEQLEKVRPLLTSGAKAIFLATWVMPRMSWFGAEPATPYPYADILSKNYGVEVHQAYRLLQVLPDTHDPTLFGIDIEQVSHMQLSSFSDQPIGAPLKARRMLMNDVCPVTKVKGQESPPTGVTITTILDVPAVLNYIWAFNDKGIQTISKALSTGENRSQFRDDPETTWKPPFSVGLAIEKTFGENEPKSRVVVLGTGASLADYYLTRRVPRFLGEGKRARFQTDPPPTENAELFINAALWLCDQEGMIASGPSQIPLVPVLKAGTQTKVLTVTMVWAAIVFVVGIVVMLVRSK